MILYVCNSYYHILISTIKVLLDNDDNKKYTIILSDDNNSISFDDIQNKLIYFENVYIEKFPKYLNNCNKTRLGLIKKNIYICFHRLSKRYDLKKYEKIYIFNDTTIIGRLINKTNKKYVLLEDGKDCFKNNRAFLLRNNKIKHILKKIFKIYELGDSNNIEYIEVNDLNGIKINKKLMECRKDELFSKLNEDDIAILKKVFLENIDIEKINNKVLIITQPLFEDKIVSSQKEQIAIYNKIIKDKKYLDKDIIFKPHPRETIDYSYYFPDSYIIKEKFPIELLSFFPNLVFKEIITISSTSIDLMDNTSNKCVLGWDWLEKYERGEINE